MVYIVSIALSLGVFVSLFYIPYKVSLIALASFFILHIIVSRSFIRSIKRAIHMVPYFFAVFLLQAFNPRGEYYSLFGIFLDKKGVDFTVTYFVKILSVLYFLSIFFTFIAKVKLPKNAFAREMVRISIFMKIVRKSSFIEFNKIKHSKLKFRKRFMLLQMLISNIYERSFRYYPYDGHIEKTF